MNNIPKGYRLVPVEPTSEMVLAGINTDLVETGDDEFDQQEDYRRVWRSMVEDAPTPTQPIYDEAKELESCRSSWEETGVGVAFADYWQGWNSRAKAGEVGHA